MADASDLPDGLYDRIIDRRLATKLGSLAPRLAALEELKDLDAIRDRLVEAIRREVAASLDPEEGGLTIDACVSRANAILRSCATDGPASAEVEPPIRRLTSIHPASQSPGILPETGLLASCLFAAGKGTPSLLSELRSELGAVDGVDILVAFITWSGVRKLQDILEKATAVDASGKPRLTVRVLSTTYCGNTERRALDWLASLPGVAVRISLDGTRTRLHAKAWILHRRSGFGSAFVGSANLSAAAMTGGLEWTVKFTQAGDPALYDRATAHFETLWNDAEFQAYDPKNPAHVDALDRALATERGNRRPGDGAEGLASVTWLGIEPRPFQVELLDRLAAERRHGRMRNLLVAATGTGKTVVAAFDYRRTCEALGGRPRLLFVAHRGEILRQARHVFANVLRDPSFGEVLADGSRPSDYDHCFATVQSLGSQAVLARFPPDHWDTVIVDECHHMPAESYAPLLTHLKPRVLLGLTATPERADGQNILRFFDVRPDGSASAELRLWQALDQQLLAPFEYYGCADDTDLSSVPWDRAAGERAALESLVNANSARAMTALIAFRSKVADARRARALGFCVSVEHSNFMAETFRKHGIPAEAVTGDTPAAIRGRAPGRLERREVNVLFTCDLYNEGIDIPSVDTILFLRPTQSPVVFQQQLGRGLRRADQKDACVVIDLVGRHRVEFRFDRLLGVLTGLPRRRILEQAEHGFSDLPPGCHIQLDAISRERVLASLRFVTAHRWRALAQELQAYAAVAGSRRLDLQGFLVDQGLELEACYPERGPQPTGWTALQRQAGLLRGHAEVYEIDIGRRLPGVLHHEDPTWLGLVEAAAEGQITYAAASEPVRRQLDMLAGELFPSRQDPCTGEELLSRLAVSPSVRSELGQLSALLAAGSDLQPTHLPGVPAAWPLVLHATYTLRELMMACGWISGRDRKVPQGGVLALPNDKIEFLFVTLDKTSGFSARTSYHDYAISPTLFHWQSQNGAGPDTPSGRRYLRGGRDGWVFQLFVRETKEDAYRAMGPVSLVTAEGAKPMSITWKLEVPLPAALFRRFSVLRSA